jgi:ribonuclease HI
LVAEALAAREGLKLARQLEFSDIILESDSSILVRILNEEVPDRSLIAGIWHECRELCMSFNNVKVCYVHREGNADAPVLVWLADVPQWLKDAAAMDCNQNLVE